uniref:Uncharacterized protein n=1 Tax=Denticeps clupeoides TaxID=299321 RepID=A0AAY4BWD9_9TELE
MAYVANVLLSRTADAERFPLMQRYLRQLCRTSSKSSPPPRDGASTAQNVCDLWTADLLPSLAGQELGLLAKRKGEHCSTIGVCEPGQCRLREQKATEMGRPPEQKRYLL